MALRLPVPTPVGSRPADARLRASLAGFALGLGLLAGCESPSPHTLLGAEPDPVRPTEPATPPAAPAVPSVYDTLSPGSGAIRLPSTLQSYGL